LAIMDRPKRSRASSAESVAIFPERHASERKPYDSGASEILANRYLVKRY